MYKRLLSVILMSFLLFSGCGPKSESTKTVKIIGIMDLSADPGAYTGMIAIEGVVQAVDEKRFLFRLIDEAEYESCGLNPCGTAGIITIYTPDSSKPLGNTPSDYTYDVKMPKVEDRVTVEGEVKKTDQGYTFEVEKVLRGSSTIIAKK